MTLEGLDLPWIWMIIAALLAGAELLAPGIFLIFLAGAALLTGFLALLGLPLAAQLAVFPLLTLGSVWVGKRWYHRNPVASSDPLLNDRLARVVGETATVVEAIHGGSGRVKLGDSIWAAKGPDAETGTRVRITGTEGACLRVERIEILPTA